MPTSPNPVLRKAVPRTRLLSPLVGTLLLIASANLAAAQPQLQNAPLIPGWSLLLSPYGWAASLRGKGSLAGIDTHIDVPFSDIVNHLDFAVMGNAEITNGTIGAYVDGQYVETSQTEQIFSQRVALGISTTRLSAGAYFKLYEIALGGNTVFGRPMTVSFEPTAGVRWTKLGGEIGVLGLGFGKRSDWYDPFLGLRVNADLSDRWNLFAEADVGGTGSSQYSVHGQVYLGYRTQVLGRETVLRAGYRVIHQDYETDDFTRRNRFRWSVTQHGPAVGLTMRF